MGSSQLKANIKKIEIINKAIKEEWQQSIRVILGDIELNNDNLIELRRFRPDEAVHVSIESNQMQFFDVNQQQDHKDTNANKVNQQSQGEVVGDDEQVTRRNNSTKEPFLVEEGDVPLGENDVVEKEFMF